MNFCDRINFWKKGPYGNSFKLFYLSLILILSSYISIHAQSNASFNTLIVDSIYAQSLNSAWKPIEKSFFILDSTIPPPATWLAFKNLDANSSFNKIDKNKISLQLNQSSWIKMKIENKLATTLDLVIYVKSSKADVYIVGQDQLEQKLAGDFYPRSLWNTENSFKEISDPYVVTFQLKPHELKDIVIKLGPYIKVRDATIALATNEYAYKSLSSRYSTRNLIQGFCMGMLSIILLYNLLIFFASESDRIYLLNSLYILSLICWFFTTSGFDRLTFLSEYPSFTEFLRISSGYGIGAFYIMFSQAIIARQNIPKTLNKLIKYMLYLILLGIFFTNIFTWIFLSFNLSNMVFIRSIFPPIGLLGIIVSLLFIVHMFKLGTKLSNVIAISSCFVIIAAILAVFGDFIFLFGKTSGSLKTASFSYSLIIEFAFIFQMLFFGFALGIRAKELEKEKVKLEELNSIKSDFFTNISHEIRTPLTLLLSPIKKVISELEDKAQRVLLETSYRSGNRMLNLVNQILDLSKIEANSMPLNITYINIVVLFKECLSLFGSKGSQRNIKLSFKSSSPEIYIYADQDKMEKIALNLISNAVKFNKENGSVEIFIEEGPNSVKISIKDQGIGIDKNELSQIFNRFYQVNATSINTNSSSGIGLALVKELVELHHGNIGVESELNKGTTFTFWLKKDKAHFENVKIDMDKLPKKIIDDTVIPDIPSEKASTHTVVSAETPIILVIEDHYELHDYIKGLLSSHYQVLSAYNGSVGIDKAIKIVPDLIVSDVMMPEKDGLEVCSTLKNDQRTSHIPIILLTAKADIEAKIEGLETGADDYLAKPFDHQELLIRIKNLLHQRATLRQKFKNELHFVPEEITSNLTDKGFIQRILQVVQANLSNESFGVDELASEMAMSRTQLNRKLRDLLDQPTNKFIQSCRLNRALELLKTQGNNVSQVAHATGFSSDAYFVKCFKEHFGSTPGKYFDQK